ncbi:hypothetical protein HK104_004739 [Borealophlyctis nickersoniae]|nr:hypothetical protein HK104_004739 [Borealophlyctis nickersoniae]
MVANLANYTGTWSLTGGDQYQDVLAAQSVGFVMRKIIANLTITYVVTNEIVGDKDVKLQDVDNLNNVATWIVDGQEHETKDPIFGPMKYVCTRNEQGFIVLRAWSEKYKWENVAVWELNGDTQIRKNVFKSPKLNKEFEMVFTKKA